MAGERIAFQGLPARICWLGYGERRRLGLRFNELVAKRRDQRADRDRPRPPRLGLGGLALPRDRVDARRLRRDRRLAAAQRARQHGLGGDLGLASTTAAASGSAARSTPGWSASPTAPSSPPRSSTACSPPTPGTGVMRHADAGLRARDRGRGRARRPHPDGERERVTVLPIREIGHPVLRERGARGHARGAGLARGADADRRHDRDQAGGQRRRDRRQPGRRVAADRDRGGPAEQPALPVQAADPAHGARQPGDRAARRRAGGDQRGLPLGAGPARRAGPPRQRPRALPGPRRGRARPRSSAASPPAPSSTRSTTSTASSSSTARTRARSAPGSSYERYARDDFERRARLLVQRVGS